MGKLRTSFLCTVVFFASQGICQAFGDGVIVVPINNTFALKTEGHNIQHKSFANENHINLATAKTNMDEYMPSKYPINKSSVDNEINVIKNIKKEDNAVVNDSNGSSSVEEHNEKNKVDAKDEHNEITKPDADIKQPSTVEKDGSLDDKISNEEKLPAYIEADKSLYKEDDSRYKATPTIEQRLVPSDLPVVKSIIRSNKTYKRENYASDEIFANFREVKTTGISAGVLFRTSNPTSESGNKVRHIYADALAAAAGINTEINVAETDAEIRGYINKKNIRDKYCAELYRQGRVLGAPLDGITSRATAWPNMAKVLRFMIANDGPYLIHCNEGKDRAGFLAVLLEALAGASREEIKKDYMKSFENYYHIVPGSREYEVINRYQGDYQIFVLANTKYASQGLKVDLDKMDISNIIPEKAAIRYCRHALKLTEEEISLLQNKLRGKI